MTEVTLQRLKSSGWTPGRKVDISQIEEAYADAEMEIPPKLREFFEEFGFLSIEHEKKHGGCVCKESHIIDPRTDFLNYDKEDYSHFFEDWGVFGMICPVGFACRGNMKIYYSEKGNFFLFMEGGPLILCGNTAESLLGGLCGDDSIHQTWSHCQEPPFEGVVMERLVNAGWSMEYEADITSIEEAYAKAGLVMPEKLRNFFRYYGFLTFSWGKKENLTDERHVIDPRMGLQYLSKEQFEHCFDDYGIYGTAYPVGSAYRDNMDILYHDDGNFYLFMSPDPLIRCGNTIKGFIDGLLGGDDSGWETLDE